MPRHLVLRFQAPLMGFGGPAIDAWGSGQDFPALSMVTGLLANALGWEHRDVDRLERLQDRLRFGARLDRPGLPLTDFQTVALGKDDRGWTTRGAPEGREGGAGSYQAPHLRYRDYWADRRCLVVLRLEPADEQPGLDALAAALDEPARPLFLGRKSCLPATALLPVGDPAKDPVPRWIEAPDIRDALAALPWPERGGDRLAAFWPVGEGEPGLRHDRVSDRRRWSAQVHQGDRSVCLGELSREPLS